MRNLPNSYRRLLIFSIFSLIFAAILLFYYYSVYFYFLKVFFITSSMLPPQSTVIKIEGDDDLDNNRRTAADFLIRDYEFRMSLDPILKNSPHFVQQQFLKLDEGQQQNMYMNEMLAKYRDNPHITDFIVVKPILIDSSYHNNNNRFSIGRLKRDVNANDNERFTADKDNNNKNRYHRSTSSGNNRDNMDNINFSHTYNDVHAYHRGDNGYHTDSSDKRTDNDNYMMQDDFYLYRMNVFGDTILLNLSRSSLTATSGLLAPSFIVQHIDTNFTYVENNIKTTSKIDRCLYTGRVLVDGRDFSDKTDNTPSGNNNREDIINEDKETSENGGATFLNLCQGMYGIVALPQGTFFMEPLIRSSHHERHNHQHQLHHVLYKHRPLTFHDSKLERRRKSKPMNVHNNKRRRKRKLRNHHKKLPIRQGFETKLANQFGYHHRHRQLYLQHHRDPRSIKSHQYYVEVLVVADARLRRYHDRNLENYVLTLMSIVASIYKHFTLEAAINIVVVRLMVLDHDHVGPKITNNAQETLKHFCYWQQTVNEETGNANHHDVAILLTRHDICRSPGKCDTLGLAELGTLCDPSRSCAIIEDNGLSAAFTIAHELGHIFNIPHDDEKKCSDYMSLDKYNFHIMAPTLEFNTHPWSWSECSSKLLRQFLDDRTITCLDNLPYQQKYVESMPVNPNPGRFFNVDQQCQFVFGPTASLCPYMPTCKRLWCTTSSGYQVGCRTQHMPWADGTPCGYNKWCYRGECVGVSPDQLLPEDGGWGEWKEWGECSRTCGSGVQRSERLCDNPRPNNGGQYCIGDRVRRRSCNVKECPVDRPDFREVQCAEFNNDRRGIHGVPANVRWVPQYVGISPNDRCKLYCAVESRADFYLMKSKVIDGTLCDRESDDICFDGKCNKAGCDGYLDSQVTRDQCGICGGDGTRCRKQHGSFNEQTTYGYNSVLRIQAGVNHIDIRQRAWNSKKDDDNYLALSNSEGEFLLNGHFQVSVFHREIRVQGAILEYSGSDTAVERINSSKPILEDLYLHVLSVGQLKPPDISWEYLVLDDPQVAGRTIRYVWRLGDWSECSKLCQGSQTRRPICLSVTDNVQVDDRYCHGYRQPVMEERACHTNCQIKWMAEYVTECSAVCGAGERDQRAFCVQSTEIDRRVDEEYCRDMEKPPAKITCFKDCAGRQYSYSEWSECTASCGGGVQRRVSHCSDTSGNTIDERYCENLIADLTEQRCNHMPCPRWQFGEWEECSHTCGGGFQRRTSTCVDGSGNELDSRLCNTMERADRRKCNEHVCTKWSFGEWSQCSASCGDGLATREARCVGKQHDEIMDEKYCVQEQKITSKPCHTLPCPRWVLGEWSQCSRTCLDGWSTRRVTCLDGRDVEVDPKYCTAAAIGGTGASDNPPSHKPCNLGPCPFWRIQDWSECSVSCDIGQRQRIVQCVYKDEVVDSLYCRDSPEPERYQTCQRISCPEWEAAQWDQCSTTCGQGYQRRLVQCIYPDSKHPAESELLCNKDKMPKKIRECERKACTEETTQSSSSTLSIISWFNVPSLMQSASSQIPESPTKWEMGDWTECSVTCGMGQRMRYVACRDVYNRILADVYCSHDQKPIDKETCSLAECGEWKTDSWSQCPATCGNDHKQTRNIYCTSMDAHNKVDTVLCDPALKPLTEQQCQLPVCSAVTTTTVAPVLPSQIPQQQQQEKVAVAAGWRVGEWTQCSRTCGFGWQRRWVMCPAPPLLRMLGSGKMHPHPHHQCQAKKKPVSVRSCQIKPCYQWSAGAWTKCSKSCEGGLQHRVITCVSSNQLQTAPAHYCSQQPPKSVQPCNQQACNRYVWRSGKWSLCSSTCGRGIRTRDVDCYDTENNVTESDDSLCKGDEQPKPLAAQNCRMPNCPRWQRGKWTPCSATCGEGLKTRKLYCTVKRRTILPDNNCSEADKPIDSTPCFVQSCPSYSWKVGIWSKCSQQCGIGTKTRTISCFNNYGQKAPNDQCSGQLKPVTVKNCTNENCQYLWVAGSWSACTKSCGEGEQYRTLHCQLKTSTGNKDEEDSDSSRYRRNPENHGPRVPAKHCQDLAKPVEVRTCSLGSCVGVYFWKVDDWSPCSVTCGWGVQERLVYCTNNSSRVDRSLCGLITKPKKRRRCFSRNCNANDCSEVRDIFGITQDGTYEVLVSGRKVKIYCYAMNSTSPKEYLTLSTDPAENFSEFYGKRLLFPFTCPYNGHRNNSCLCTEEHNPKPGLTTFSKIRVDLHNMKINIMDSRFATIQFGDFVPYASAGDCYSAVNCPQGKFSINLRGTGFRIAKESEWMEDGHRTYKLITRLDEGAVIQGHCGGYCGKCYPDKTKGLLIEIDQWQFNEVN